MGSFKDFFKIQFGGLVLFVQENTYKVKTWFQFLPSWQRVLIYIYLFLLIPGYVLTRYGAEAYFTNNYASESLSAHPSYANPDKLQQTKVTVIQNPSGTTSAYAVITNNNLDLALEDLKYTFTFYNSSNEEVGKSSGQTFILPNQKKWLVVPKIQSIQPIVTGKLALESLNWQKRLNVPEVDIKMAEPYVYEQVNPLATVTEGAIVNNSPYKLKQASIVLVLYDANNKVIAISTREEYSLLPYERRAYKISWPSIYRNQVNRVGLEAYTDSLDPDNLSVENSAASNFVEPK